MKTKRRNFSPISLALTSFTSWVLLVVGLASAVEAIKTADFVQLAVSLGFSCIIAFLLYLAITYRKLEDEQVEEYQLRDLELPGRAPIAPNSPNWIISVHVRNTFGREKLVVVAVDLTEERIHFKDCFVPNRFWGGWESSSYASCPLSEVLSVPYVPNYKHPGGQMHIITKSGKAVLSDDATNYTSMRRLLMDVTLDTPPAAPVDSPHLFVWIMAGTLVGIFIPLGFIPLGFIPLGFIPLGVNREGVALILCLGGLVGGLIALIIAWTWGQRRSKDSS